MAEKLFDWCPILAEPIPGSGERVTIAVALYCQADREALVHRVLPEEQLPEGWLRATLRSSRAVLQAFETTLAKHGLDALAEGAALSKSVSLGASGQDPGETAPEVAAYVSQFVASTLDWKRFTDPVDERLLSSLAEGAFLASQAIAEDQERGERFRKIIKNVQKLLKSVGMSQGKAGLTKALLKYPAPSWAAFQLSQHPVRLEDNLILLPKFYKYTQILAIADEIEQGEYRGGMVIRMKRPEDMALMEGVISGKYLAIDSFESSFGLEFISRITMPQKDIDDDTHIGAIPAHVIEMLFRKASPRQPSSRRSRHVKSASLSLN